MKSSPIILAVLCAAAVSAEPTPTPTPSPTPIPASLLSPPDGAVYQVGDPILIDREFTDGCGGESFIVSPSRGIDLISVGPPYHGISLAELATETVHINLPGTYQLVRTCRGQSTSLIYRNTFTVEAPCGLLNPVPTPAPPGAPVPSIQAGVGTGGVSGALQVLTLDNSFNSLYYFLVANQGDSDLVIIDIFPWIEFDSLKIDVVDFVPYTVVRPGHVAYFPMVGTVTNPSVAGSLGIGHFIIYVKTNDPNTPLFRANSPGLYFFPTEESIPPHFKFPGPPPANPATPECADQNSDGTVDASDVVNFVLGASAATAARPALELAQADPPAEPSALPLQPRTEPTPTPYPSPTPPAPSLLSPPDGAVYQVGDPILIEREFTDGCGGGAPGDFLTTPDRLVRLISGDGIKSIGLAELTPETLRINIPGAYEVIRFCTSGTFDGEETLNHFTVEAPCPLLDPEPTPAPPGAPVPSIQAGALIGGDYYTVITLDNSVNVLPYLRIRNLGTADLVLIDILPWIDFDSIIIQPVDFVPYTVVRPGHTFYVELEAMVTNPSVFGSLGMGNFVFYAKTNDPVNSLRKINVTGYYIFQTADDIPDNWVLSPGPPANPATPECADQNADGTVDAADVVNFVLSR